MVKVITYGTYDLLHYGHKRLLERAKALGDYLIVGVTAESFDKSRGKINVQQSLMERIEGVRATGLADEIIVEEYEGQKIDDIRRYGVDIFTVGSDWVGKFDYLEEYCKVVYLPRTEGVSSSQVRSKKRKISVRIVEDKGIGAKIANEGTYVNGVEFLSPDDQHVEDAIYLFSMPDRHYELIKKAIYNGKHILCESPITMNEVQCRELFDLARKKNVVLMDALKTAYGTAYNRLLLLVKSGAIGKVISVDATCTSLMGNYNVKALKQIWSSITAWGPTALLPVFQILGTDYIDKNIVTQYIDEDKTFDGFTKIDFLYPEAVATIKVAKTAKSEGNLVITGTKGYIYVPAPWWKMDYFEVKYEDQNKNKRFFYQLEGEGIRYELVAFSKEIESGGNNSYVSEEISVAIAKVMEDWAARKVREI
ncbi:adenylyltransferase/cytidyltransferase family protein [Anaerovibrio sp.]|uniref:adenylyltransferase/cytidyltransferase family protein n=1 Tax=Anaerovibrio sp. TaxID=1872532 RepID=UPI0025B9F16B|nr:adenylyltransferase/cytidyltransferase family protein [Anaerovibrio sp.]MBR2142006.1 adenylyltransferase/cytidyltransferase family protein [Anaerovibrio sp.]